MNLNFKIQNFSFILLAKDPNLRLPILTWSVPSTLDSLLLYTKVPFKECLGIFCEALHNNIREGRARKASMVPPIIRERRNVGPQPSDIWWEFGGTKHKKATKNLWGGKSRKNCHLIGNLANLKPQNMPRKGLAILLWWILQPFKPSWVVKESLFEGYLTRIMLNIEVLFCKWQPSLLTWQKNPD